MTNDAWKRLVLLMALCALLFSLNIGGYELWPSDEPRFGQVAREMLQSGDFLLPHVNDQPYKEKPPLLFWAIAAVSAPFGDVSAATARIPSVAAALVAILCTFILAHRMYGARVAFWSGLMLATATRFWWQARTAQTDTPLMGALAAALLFFWLWHEKRRIVWLIAFYAAVTAAVYAKGPPGIVFPLLLIFTFYWGRKDERKQTHWLIGTLCVAALIGLWVVPAYIRAAAEMGTSTEAALGQNLFFQTIGRFFLGVSKAQWPWYYLVNLPVDWLPWSLFFPWTAWWVWRRRKEGDSMRLLLAWTVPAFIFFSISIGKRAIYLLPIYPALAILVARSVIDLVESDRVNWRRRTALAWALLLLALAALPLALRFTEYAHAWRPTLAIFSAAALLFAADSIRRFFMTSGRRLHAAMAFHYGLLLALAALFIFPVVNEFKSAEPFCRPLRLLSEDGEDYRLYSLVFSREEYVFYSKHFHEPVLTGVIDMEPPEGWELSEVLYQQRRLRIDIADAVEEVPVASYRDISEQEIARLREAISRHVREDAELDAVLAEAMQAALTAEVRAFAVEFRAPVPSYLFVRQEDWLWLMVFDPSLRLLPIVAVDSVGSRDVLLVANEAGAELMLKEKVLPPDHHLAHADQAATIERGAP
jgi:4-amino-4-deoxy-L-arabinose transferase-like glycosyltransferase